ncbi:hypothetical protein AK830_g2855 [Neonectria ditissima]|uniref:DUF8004 domain-containing protein n=1 Tax=Neonectria ditissima TaxID=78410 RepID=A0A0P7BR79_9HYPO|nr:hypothetical protein AK830_g2855 [Neonectria ditissima]
MSRLFPPSLPLSLLLTTTPREKAGRGQVFTLPKMLYFCSSLRFDGEFAEESEDEEVWGVCRCKSRFSKSVDQAVGWRREDLRRLGPAPTSKFLIENDPFIKSLGPNQHALQDPELWLRNGNCLVHLYGKGESRRGPSFKIPLVTLLEAKCYPLVQRFIDWEGIQTPNDDDLAKWSHKNPARRVDLYVPAPPTADRTQAFQYHVATRNLLAWACRRSMVGASLGGAAAALLHSMHEFRSGVDDNVADMMDYFDEEGYLDMANQPNHALAMLHLAELFQMGELYTRAFAHCVGMSEHLLASSEFQVLITAEEFGGDVTNTARQFITPESRKLIRRARSEMETRLTSTSNMLKTFLDDELSEAHLSVSEAARAHLERFRSFLLSFYTTQLGYYPPTSSSSTADDFFDAGILRTMREDFEALYDLLVDDQHTATSRTTAYGGICTIQLVHAFDMRHDYTTLAHPLPLVPASADSSRRMAWLPGRDRLRSDRRVTAHAGLIRASNLAKPGVAQNDLVRAYRRFEEESIISPNKADRQEKVSLVDARKVRWILVYAVYQVLRSATDTPAEAERDCDEAAYSLAVSTEHVPPWKKTPEMERILRRQTELFTGSANLIFPDDDDDDTLRESPGKIEIKPDIDYFALTHQKPPARDRRDSVRVLPEHQSALPSRSNSLSRALSRSSTIRRSMRMFKTAPNTPPQTATTPSRPAYHEILVHGYGNGTNDVNLSLDGPYMDTTTWPELSDSATSTMDGRGGSTPESLESATDTLDSLVESPPLTAYYTMPQKSKSRRQKRREVVSMVACSMSARVPKRRPISTIFAIESPSKTGGDAYDHDATEQQLPQRSSSFRLSHPLPPLPRSLTRHSLLLPDRRRKEEQQQQQQESAAQAQAGLSDEDGEPYIVSDDADWTDMQAFMDPDALEVLRGDVTPGWEQYAELGGLTDMR